jgi:hypothetical protein
MKQNRGVTKENVLKIDRQRTGYQCEMLECPEKNELDLDLYEVLYQH